MKNFLKTVLGTIVGLMIFGIFLGIILVSFVGSLAALKDAKPIVLPSSVMTIDMSKIVLTEQTQETDILSMIQSKDMETQTLGIYNAVKTINSAASDPSISFIYMKPDAAMGGMAQIEELRKALLNFRKAERL